MSHVGSGLSRLNANGLKGSVSVAPLPPRKCPFRRACAPKDARRSPPIIVFPPLPRTHACRAVWCGNDICQARNASGSPIREHLTEGEYLPGGTPTSLYYGIDQIGSIRRVFSSAGSSPAYSYDPFGTELSGTPAVTDFGYAGMMGSSDNSLTLALHRIYQPGLGRWISRDPAGEVISEKYNLYNYASNDPISLNDPTGLCPNPLQSCLIGMSLIASCVPNDTEPLPVDSYPTLSSLPPNEPSEPAPRLTLDPVDPDDPAVTGEPPVPDAETLLRGRSEIKVSDISALA
jgi:RHS repeat-associated protein